MFSVAEQSIFLYDEDDNFSKKVLEKIGVERYSFSETRNPTGEYILRLNNTVRRKNVFVLMSLIKNPQESLVKMCLMLSALKNGDANRVTAVIPAMCYVKDDSYIPRSPLAPRLMIKLLETAGADSFIFLDMHSQKQRGYGEKKKDDIKPRTVFAADMIKRFGNNITLIPLKRNDISRAEDYKDFIPGLDVVALNFDGKTFSKDVEGKKIVVVSDMVTNAKRLLETIELLEKAGAAEVHAYMTHALFVDNAVQEIEKSFLSTLTVSDSLELSGGAINSTKIIVLSLIDYFARALREIDSGDSLGKMNN